MAGRGIKTTGRFEDRHQLVDWVMTVRLIGPPTAARVIASQCGVSQSVVSTIINGDEGRAWRDSVGKKYSMFVD